MTIGTGGRERKERRWEGDELGVGGEGRKGGRNERVKKERTDDDDAEEESKGRVDISADGRIAQERRGDLQQNGDSNSDTEESRKASETRCELPTFPSFLPLPLLLRFLSSKEKLT